MVFPDYVKNNHGLMNVSGDNDLCFFQFLAVHRDGDRRWYERNAQKLFNDYCTHFEIVYNAFTGVNLSDFVDFEDFFKINLVVYELEGGVAKLVQRSWALYFETMRLNIWENHLSLIVDFEHYCSVYIDVFIVGSCGTKAVTITTIPKLVKPRFVSFFQGLSVKTRPPYLKNWKKLVFVSLKTTVFTLIVATILRLIFPNKIFLKTVLN